jgi:adenine-specific DNA-methyltransferase
MPGYDGRLELTWTNKHLRLLAHEDGSYQWVSPSDYRVSEVRLLHDITSVGQVGKSRAGDNLLIRGDALNALTSLAQLPEFAEEYLGKIKLAYCDPPFNTQQSFLQYDDALEHSVWLTMIRDRLVKIRDLLSMDGSLWLHLDDSEMHRARCVLDEVFGPEHFVASVIWHRTKAPKNSAVHLSMDHDYLIGYAKDGTVWRSNLLPRTESMDSKFKNPDSDPRGDWFPDNLSARNYYSKGTYSIVCPSGRVIAGPPKGRFWRFSEERFKELDADGRIWWGVAGDKSPTYKLFLREVRDGRVASSVWPPEEVGYVRNGKQEIKALFPEVDPFATPKPEALMQRVITVASKPGDVVLDPFAGSGTTLAVAQKMGRRWVGVEREAATIDTFALPRLRKVVSGDDPGGVTELTGWAGGGGFRVLDVAPSMFEAEGGLVFLADWMTNGALAEATAAQLGFEYEQDPPFAGRKGRTRLAVVDGVVNESVVRLIVSALPERERVVVCGTGIDTDARPVLRELRPGSTLRKIPAALLDEYRSARQLRMVFADDAMGSTARNGAKQPIETRA